MMKAINIVKEDIQLGDIGSVIQKQIIVQKVLKLTLMKSRLFNLKMVVVLLAWVGRTSYGSI